MKGNFCIIIACIASPVRLKWSMAIDTEYPRLAPVEVALAELDTMLDQVIKLAADDGLDGHDALATVAFLRRFEHLRNRMALVDLAIIGHCDRYISWSPPS